MSTARTVIAVLDARPGRAEDLATAITELAPAVRAEAGCSSFAPFRSQHDPHRFYVYEVYRDDDAFEAHLVTVHVQRFVDSLDAISTNGRTAAERVVHLSAATAAVPVPVDQKEQS